MSFLSALRAFLPTSFLAEDYDALKATRPDTLVLDVREPHEFAEGHIAGSVLVPMGKLPHHAGEIAKAGKPVVLVCRSGARASGCEGVLRSAGVQEAHVLSGGVLAWARHGRKLVTGSKSPSLMTALKAKA